MQRLPLLLWRQRSQLGLLLVVILTATEALLRILWGFGHPLLVAGDPDIGYYFKAHQDISRFGNQVKINAFHQRNGTISPKLSQGMTRVMVVGDSVTFGGTLTDQNRTITAVLERGLTSHEADSWEVLNASAGSWGIGNALAYLERFGVFDSKLICLQIGSHDLLQGKSTQDVVGVHPAMPTRNPSSAITEVIFRYLIPRIKRTVARRSSNSGRGPRHKTPDSVFETNMFFLRTAVHLCRRHDARVFVLHTPDRDEVVASSLGNFSTKYSSYRRRFLKECAAIEIPVINLPETWKGKEKANQWFSDSVHLTPSGNLEIAKITIEMIKGSKGMSITKGTE